MLVKTEAIVLHSFKYGEARLIVDMFTREVGRLSFAIPIPKTSKGRLKKQYFQPMTLLEVECDVRQRSQLQKMKDARLLTAYTSIPFSPEKLAITLFTAEFLCHALRAEQQNEPLFAYLMIAEKQYDDIHYAGYYNVGPDDVDCYQTGALVDVFVSKWGEGMKWINKYDGGPHESNFLKLDCSKLKITFGWKHHWNLDMAIEKVVEWSKCWVEGGDVRVCMDKEIEEFLGVEK